MNEDNENQLATFLRALQRQDFIEDLEKLILEKTGGSIHLCFLPADKKNLNLFVGVGKKLSSNEEVSFTGVIMRKFGYDSTAEGAEINVQFSSLFDEGKEKKLYDEMIPLTKKNFLDGSIQAFLGKHYSEFFNSPQSSRSSDGSKDSNEENMGLKADILELLKSKPLLWQKLTAEEDSPDVLGELQQEIKAAIKKDSPTSGSSQTTFVK
ncbi:MAG: hypothetical protein SFW07_03525 [Gammaproteobacteria bacterium]|nr:hypothetical protein [Gammaproteobacteria bacterium]